MAIPLQTKYPLSPITNNNIPRSHRPSLLPLRVTNTTTNSHPNRRENLVVEKRLVNPPLSNDQTLQSTWLHSSWVTTGCTTVFASFSKSIIGGFHSHLCLEPALADESPPLVGTQIEAARGHHKWPWIITRRHFANNLNVLGLGTTLMVLPLVLGVNDHVVHGFVSMFGFCVLFCQQFHAWSHGSKSKLPPLMAALQDMGLLVSRRQHVNHHRPPYNSYCIVSGVWNKVLDESKFFEVLEMVLYFKFGVRSRSWSEQDPKLSEETHISNDQA